MKTLKIRPAITRVIKNLNRLRKKVDQILLSYKKTQIAFLKAICFYQEAHPKQNTTGGWKRQGWLTQGKIKNVGLVIVKAKNAVQILNVQ